MNDEVFSLISGQSQTPIWKSWPKFKSDSVGPGELLISLRSVVKNLQGRDDAKLVGTGLDPSKISVYNAVNLDGGQSSNLWYRHFVAAFNGNRPFYKQMGYFNGDTATPNGRVLPDVIEMHSSK